MQGEEETSRCVRCLLGAVVGVGGGMEVKVLNMNFEPLVFVDFSFQKKGNGILIYEPAL